jgi:arabinose-5-phosphate isomerase
MTASPIVISPDASLKDAVVLMEERTSQISVLPVVGPDNHCLGLVRIHDVYQSTLS